VSDAWSRRALLRSASAFAAVAGCAPGTTRPLGSLPNIILIFPDQLRTASVSLYGETNIATPTIDTLLQSGTHFPNTITPNPVCSPARAGLLFGRSPTSAGVKVNGQRPNRNLPSIANILREAGYHCGYIGKWHLDGNQMPGFVAPEDRFGFQSWSGYNFHHNYMKGVYFEGESDSPLQTPEYLPFHETALALDFCERHPKTPFFLMLNYGPPHPTEKAPSSYKGNLPDDWLDLVDPDAIGFRPNVPEWITPYNRGEDGRAPLAVGAQEYLRGYYAATLSIDECVRRLLDGLDTLNLTGETIVCFASDHGDMAGSHGLFRKGVPFREATEVPLGFSWPGLIGAQRSPLPVSLIDIAPTLLGLSGTAIPDEFRGRDLSPWLLDGTGPEITSSYSEGGYNSIAWDMVRTRDWAFAMNRYGTKALGLYDMVNDPYQLVNLLDTEIAEEYGPDLHAKLINWRFQATN
jgi:arylsulfatase A-like enzyme